MQNKPNLQKSQVNVKHCKKMTYENIANWTLGENKPKQTQFYPPQADLSAVLSADLSGDLSAEALAKTEAWRRRIQT